MRAIYSIWVGIGLLCIGPFALADKPAVQLSENYRQIKSPVDKIYAKLREQLAAPTKFAFIDTPLVEVALYLSTLHGIDIQFDRRAMEEVGISPDHLITVDLERISLQSGLRLMLAEIELTYLVENGCLWITTPEAAEMREETIFYSCPDLLNVVDDAEPDYDSLRDLILTVVSAESWGLSGSTGIQAWESGIVVRQMQEIQPQIAALLEALHAAKLLSSEDYDPTPIDLSTPIAARRKAIREELSQPTRVHFVDTPLVEVAQYFRDRHRDLPIWISQKKLEEIGKSVDLPVTIDVEGRSLGDTLHIVLRDLELTYVVDHEAILITSPLAAESHFVVKVYPIRDLVNAGANSYRARNHVAGPNADWSADNGSLMLSAFEQLKNVIEESIEPDSWHSQGGPGACALLQIADALVIVQSDQTHDKIAQLLHDIRKNQQPRPEASPEEKAQSTESVLIRYPIPLEDDENNAVSRLANLLTAEVAAESWNPQTQYVRTLGRKTLLIKQSPQTHAKIREWLGRLYPQSEYAQRLGGFGGGGFGGGGGLGGNANVGRDAPTLNRTPDAAKSGM